MDTIEVIALNDVEHAEMARRDTEAEAMGKWKSKEHPSPQVERIVDRVWDRFVSVSECDDRLALPDLYCTILLVYNDINKVYPGPWNDPPKRKEVEDMLKTLDRETSQSWCSCASHSERHLLVSCHSCICDARDSSSWPSSSIVGIDENLERFLRFYCTSGDVDNLSQMDDTILEEVQQYFSPVSWPNSCNPGGRAD